MLVPKDSRAQNTFAPVGAEWWYGGYNIDYAYGTFQPDWNGIWTWTDHVVSIKDTVITGQNCRQLQATRMERHSDHPDSTYMALQKFMYLFNNDDTVFILNESIGNFSPLYVYNSNIGNTVILPQFKDITGFTDSFSFIIDSVKNNLYDTSLLKTYYTHSVDTVSYGTTLNWGILKTVNNQRINIGQYTEKIGGTFRKVTGFYPAYNHGGTEQSVSIEFPSGELRCYSESGLYIKLTNLPCDTLLSPVTVGLNEMNTYSNNITVFPNPANDAIYIKPLAKFSKNSSCYLQDCTGKRMTNLIRMPGKSDIKIQTAHLAEGLYILILQQDGQRFYKKVVVRH